MAGDKFRQPAFIVSLYRGVMAHGSGLVERAEKIDSTVCVHVRCFSGAPKVRGLHNPPFRRDRPEKPEIVHGAALLEDHPRRDRNRGRLQRGNDQQESFESSLDGGRRRRAAYPLHGASD